MSLLEKATKEVKETIYPFWSALEDDKYGGFYGRVDFDLVTHKDAPKGVILNSRILYFFSQYYLTFHDKDSFAKAKHAYEFLKRKAFDSVNGGVYWSLDYKGNPLDTTKHTYNQAFAIYALATYYEASKDEGALELALSIYSTIENKCREVVFPYYYKEAQSLDWKPVSNTKLSENGVLASRTMNTALHVLEAYTKFYEVHPFDALKEDLVSILRLFKDKIYNSSKDRLDVFFDSDYHSLIDMESYGHEIEASCLLTRACEVLGDEDITFEIIPIAEKLARVVYLRGYEKPFINNEIVKGELDKTRVWWVEAEGVNGFLNLSSLTGDKNFVQVAEDIYQGIENHFLDKRKGGCWYWDLDPSNKPSSKKDIVEPWKCPYHNGRMCFEVIRRLGK